MMVTIEELESRLKAVEKELDAILKSSKLLKSKPLLVNNDRKLALNHVDWYMTLLRDQFGHWAAITEKLLIENFVHGIKHGRELEREENKDA